MGTLFGHENHPYPPSLFDRGKLRSTKKSDLLCILAQETESSEHFTSFDVKVLDGAAIVHLLPTTNITTFDEYASDVFISYIKKQLDTSARVDVVWDAYLSSSIKESTGRNEVEAYEERWKVETKFQATGLISFVTRSTSKNSSHSSPARLSLTDCLEGKQIFATSGTAVIAGGTSHRMEYCDHEEADTQILIHLQDTLANGSTTCLVRTVDTDVVIIIIGKFHALLAKYPAADIIMDSFWNCIW